MDPKKGSLFFAGIAIPFCVQTRVVVDAIVEMTKKVVILNSGSLLNSQCVSRAASERAYLVEQ